MPLVAADALSSVKDRLFITGATYDPLLTAMITDNVKRLYPRLQVETDTQEKTDVSPSNGEAIIDLSALGTPLVGARFVEVKGDNGFYPATDVYQHKSKLRLRELSSTISTVKIYGLVRPALSNLDDEYHICVIFLTMADFYNYLVGDKRRYNEYMQNGAPAADEMSALADFYEKKAFAELDEKAPLYGHQ